MVSAVYLSIFVWICDMAGSLCGTFVSWWHLPRIWPSVTDMQYYYRARYPTDDWHLAYRFSFVNFSVEVCLEGVFPHFVSTWRDSCVKGYAPPPPPHAVSPPLSKKNKIEQGRPSSPLEPSDGHLNWRMGLPALLGGIWVSGKSNFHLYCAVYGVCHRQNTSALTVVFCFRHFTAFQYHHYARWLTGNEHIYICL